MQTLSKKKISALRASGQFDGDWYRKSYPDVDLLGMDPAEHYLLYGYRLMRDPGPATSNRFLRIAYRMAEEHEPVARMAWMQQKGKLAEGCDAGAQVLKAAGEVAKTGRHDRAISLAEDHLPEALRYTAEILRANAAIARYDETAWQMHVNRYFAHSEITPLQLQGSGTIFDRLACGFIPAVEAGPLVSVIMPVWNAEKTVQYAARSILNQTWRNLELLIVDDASTDKTWSVLERLADSDPRVTIQRNTVNVGPYVSKNIALRRARGEWITGHDADDWAHPQRLERQVAFCQAQNTPVCLSGMLRMTGDGEFVRFNKIGGFVHDGACRSGFISLMVHGQFFHDLLGNWDEVRTSGDSEILRRIEAVHGKPVAQLPVCTMICLDNPGGLTNDPVLGHSEMAGVSPIRAGYKTAFQKFHATITRETSRLNFPQTPRRFHASEEIRCPPVSVEQLIDGYRQSGVWDQPLACDVIIATDLRFPGGNASSTIDEIEFFKSLGLGIRLINCPVNNDLGKPISDRYAPYHDLITHWSRVNEAKCRVLICRHPVVATSMPFSHVAPKIRADHAFIVKNNSSKRATGVPVYDIGAFAAAGSRVVTRSLTICPISPVMRAELQEYKDKTGAQFALSDTDWTPTFDLGLYRQAPKPQMTTPFRIGRHGRDGAEKWLEDPKLLRRAFPEASDFEIKILGGADKARRILKSLPENWTVFDFGSVEPFDYLATLDAFVYFPNTGLSEGFGRTIVEAMLGGVPVLLPPRFAETFGDLPLYCQPEDVEHVVRRLATDDLARQMYLQEVQNIAIERYSSAVIRSRMARTGLPGISSAAPNASTSLSPASAQYRRHVMPPISTKEHTT